MAWALRYPHYERCLGDLSIQQSLTAYCETPGCRHSSELDLMALLERYGPEVEIDALKRAAYCSECRKAGRPDKNLSWIHGHSGRPVGHDRHLGEIYNEKHGIT